MKKYLILSLTALAALVSCQKEDIQDETVVREPIVFTASIAQNDTKATVEVDGSKAKILWESTDKITITDGSSHVAVYKVSTGAGTKTATFIKDSGDDLDSPGTYTATFGEAPSTKFKPYSETSVPVYMTAPSTSDPDNLRFTVQGGVLKLTLTKSGEQARKIIISNASDSYSLDCTSPVSLSSGATFYMNLPAGTYTRMAVYDGNCKVAEKTGLSMVIKENTLLPASTSTLEFNTIPGALPGTFTIDENGNWVHFSKGNLRATYSTSTTSYSWSFATNQYDYVGNAAGNTTIGSQTDEAVVDLFGWVGASSSKDAYGISFSSQNINYGNASPENLKADWGVAYCNSNSITPTTVWRTLTDACWYYLFFERSASTIGGTSNARYAKVKVNGIAGLLIFPDIFTWTESMGAAPSSCNNSETSWTAVSTYDLTEFSAMESAGCVFLPAAGYRSGSNVSNADTDGYYWSSSERSKVYAIPMYFRDAIVASYNSVWYRRYGCSVRLVFVTE